MSPDSPLRVTPADPGSPPPTRLALRLVAHKKVRTAVAVSGIAFAVLFMFLQLGFLGALRATAVAVSSRFDGDLVLVPAKFLHLSDSGSMPRSRLFQARSIPEVKSVTPLHMRIARWKAPLTGRGCSMFAIGFPLSEAVPLRIEGLANLTRALGSPGSIVVDRVTQEKCGATDTLETVEVREGMRNLVGRYTLGVGFLGDGSLLSSDETYGQMFDGQSSDEVNMGLVRLEAGSDAEAIAERLRLVLPPDTVVLTMEQLNDRQTRFWVEDTAIGTIFQMGAVVGFLVGTMILFQVLSTDIRTHLPQYATMKVMGFTNRRLYLLVLQQSWLFAALGYVPALLLALLVYEAAYRATLVPIAMSGGRALLVLLLSLSMCTVAGLLSLRRIRSADPAELF